MEYISQMSDQDSSVAGSWPVSPAANIRENIPMLVKVQPKDQKYVVLPQGSIELTPKMIISPEKFSDSGEV